MPILLHRWVLSWLGSGQSVSNGVQSCISVAAVAGIYSPGCTLYMPAEQEEAEPGRQRPVIGVTMEVKERSGKDKLLRI